MEAVADMGQYGGVVVRTLKLLGEKLKPQAVVSSETLLKVPVRNRRALRDSGFMKFFDKPRGSAAPKKAKKSVVVKRGMKASGTNEAGKVVKGVISQINRKAGFAWLKVGKDKVSHKVPLASIKV